MVLLKRVAHRGEEDAAAGAREGGDAHEAARPIAVEQEPDGDLHARIAVEIGCRQMAEHGGADREVPHQFIDHDAGSHAQHPRIEKENGPGQPAQEGKEGRATMDRKGLVTHERVPRLVPNHARSSDRHKRRPTRISLEIAIARSLRRVRPL